MLDARTRRRGRSPRGVRPGPLLVVLALVCLSLMLLDVRGGPTDALRSVGAVVGAPLQRLTAGVVDSSDLRRPDAVGLEEEIQRLRADNTRLHRDNDLMREQLAGSADKARVDRLVSMLDRPVVVGRVVAAESAPARGGLTVDVGSDAGVEPDAPVIVSAGLVGRVVRVTPSTSTVQLLTDPGSAVAARLADARVTGLVRGTGQGSDLRLDLVDPLDQLAEGQRVVTMGSADDWPFPAGLTLGTVSEIEGSVGDTGRQIVVSTAADPQGLDHVAVMTRQDDAAGGGTP